MIVATILCGNNAHQIEAAIVSSHPVVDRFLLVDTGIADDSLAIARRLVGDRLVLHSYQWINDFADARNQALKFAGQLGADWCMTLDTDERLDFGTVNTVDSLQRRLDGDLSVSAWLVRQSDGSYAKERFIRLPTDLYWSGQTHEALVGSSLNKRQTLEGVAFWEEEKSAEAMEEKLLRDLQILLSATAADPTNPRDWYYLGQTYSAMQWSVHAEDAFRHCIECDGWDQQRAFAFYRLATAMANQGRHDDAMEVCGIGLVEHPDSPEIAWMAAWSAYQLQHYTRAITWCHLAIQLGNVQGIAAAEDRIAFRHLVSWYEGPYDVLRFAYQRLGQAEKAAWAEAKFQEAKQSREARIGGRNLGAVSVQQHSHRNERLANQHR